MDKVMEKKHLNAVCTVIHSGDKILCVQQLRKDPNYIAEHWEFPGSKVNEEESDHEVLRCEILEEMDWDTYVEAKPGNIECDYSDFLICLTAYDCMAYDNDFKLFAHIDSCWLKLEEFSGLDWAEVDTVFIKQLWR